MAYCLLLLLGTLAQKAVFGELRVGEQQVPADASIVAFYKLTGIFPEKKESLLFFLYIHTHRHIHVDHIDRVLIERGVL